MRLEKLRLREEAKRLERAGRGNVGEAMHANRPRSSRGEDVFASRPPARQERHGFANGTIGRYLN